MVAGAEHTTSPRRGRYAGLLLASKGCFLQIRIRGALARLERLEIERLRLLDALVMALWRRRPKQPVTVHSDQGSQFTRHDCQDFLRDHDLISSMSRRGNYRPQ